MLNQLPQLDHDRRDERGEYRDPQRTDPNPLPRARADFHDTGPQTRSEIQRQAVHGEFDSEVTAVLVAWDRAESQARRRLRKSEVVELLISMGYERQEQTP